MPSMNSAEVWQIQNFVKAAIAKSAADVQQVVDQYNATGYIDQYAEGWAQGARSMANAIAEFITATIGDAERRQAPAEPRWVY